MAGQDSFFAGQILARITVGTDGVPEVKPGESGGGERSSGGGRGRRGGVGGGLNVRGGAGGLAGNIGGNVPFGGGGERSRGDSDREGGARGGPCPMMGGMGRPVMIHLRFTNQGATPVTLTIDDFTSPLGNFAVQPEKLVLEPGQSLETEPMSSQLGGALSEANATLVLRLGPQAEKKTFTLHALPDDRPGQTPAGQQARTVPANDEPAAPAK